MSDINDPPMLAHVRVIPVGRFIATVIKVDALIGRAIVT